LSNRIARYQLVAFLGQIQQSGTAFEHLQFSVVQERNLAKRLAREMISLATIEPDRSHGIGKISVLAAGIPTCSNRLFELADERADYLVHAGEPDEAVARLREMLRADKDEAGQQPRLSLRREHARLPTSDVEGESLLDMCGVRS
jgi:hypothetical protein